MNISIKNLLPNPYRDIGNYPIDNVRVAKLQGSISDTGFWEGLICRKHPTKAGFYQMAFGHHRLQALKNLKRTEVPMKVTELTDAQMLRAMAEENREIGQHDIKIMTQTVEQVKKFLDAEFAKYESWKNCLASKSYLINLSDRNLTEGKFKDLQQNGVGRDTVLKFLGDTWKQSEIQFALEVLKDDEAKTVDRKALEAFKNPYQAKEFKAAVKEAEIPVKKQMEVAKKVAPKVKGGREIREEVYKHSPLPSLRHKKPEPKPLPMLDDYAKETCREMGNLNTKLSRVSQSFDSIQSDVVRASLFLAAKDLQATLNEIIARKDR